jgi:DNA-binding beta-propeller fold protein YncE
MQRAWPLGSLGALLLLSVTVLLAVPSVVAAPPAIATSGGSISSPTGSGAANDSIVASCHPGNYTYAQAPAYDASNHELYYITGNGMSGPGGFNGVIAYSSNCTVARSIGNVGGFSMVFDKANGLLYIGAPDHGYFTIRNSNLKLVKSPLASAIGSLTFDPVIHGLVAGEGYFSPCRDDNVTFISRNSTTNFAVPGCAVDVAYSRDGNTVFVAIARSRTAPGRILGLNATSGATRFEDNISGEPSQLAYDPADRRIYVTLASSNFTDVFAASGQLVKRIDVHFRGFTSIAYSPATHEMYLAGTDGQTSVSEIVILNRTHVVQTIPVTSGGGPSGIAYDPADGDMYVTLNGEFYYDPSVLVVS